MGRSLDWRPFSVGIGGSSWPGSDGKEAARGNSPQARTCTSNPWLKTYYEPKSPIRSPIPLINVQKQDLSPRSCSLKTLMAEGFELYGYDIMISKDQGFQSEGFKSVKACFEGLYGLMKALEGIISMGQWFWAFISLKRVLKPSCGIGRLSSQVYLDLLMSEMKRMYNIAGYIEDSSPSQR